MSLLSLRDVTKIYGQGRMTVKAIQKVSLEMKAGEVVLIMGPSGSGKTTLLSLIGGLLKPSSGTVKIKDIEITKLSEKKLPKIRLKEIGFVFQSFNLLSALTARENIDVVLDLANKKDEKRAKELLKKLGLEKRAHHKPSKLSGGEQQRVAIARALALEPDIILADEPTGNLDSKTGHNVIALLCRIACDEGRAVLIVSHDQRIRNIADRILWLEDGKITKEKKMEYEHHDLVCGMKVNRTKFDFIYKDKVYYFCSQDCLIKFKNNPIKYTKEV